MVTCSTLFILLYAYSVYKIRIDSESWKQFNPFDTNFFAGIVFLFGTSALIVAFMASVGYLIQNNIVP
jgi:hypothetical protein